MTRWLISVPVWGERCVEVFCATALPALVVAMRMLNGDARLIAHTDQPERVRAAASEIDVEIRPVPAGMRDFDCMSQAHREVLGMALRGDRVALLTADLVISACTLAYCEDRLNVGDKWFIGCASMRCLQEGKLPETYSAQELMAWGWANRHPITEACRWPRGDSHDLSRMYFERDGNLMCRVCLPHPLAVKVDGRPLKFAPTVDANLYRNFAVGEIDIVTTSDEVAMLELSPRDKAYSSAASMIARFKQGGIVIADPFQRWMLRHRIVLLGQESDCGDDEVISAVAKEN